VTIEDIAPGGLATSFGYDANGRVAADRTDLLPRNRSSGTPRVMINPSWDVTV
jgi:hypothetical protein